MTGDPLRLAATHTDTLRRGEFGEGWSGCTLTLLRTASYAHAGWTLDRKGYTIFKPLGGPIHHEECDNYRPDLEAIVHVIREQHPDWWKNHGWSFDEEIEEWDTDALETVVMCFTDERGPSVPYQHPRYGKTFAAGDRLHSDDDIRAVLEKAAAHRDTDG